MNKVIGLTGMSGAGKSTVAEIFKSLGAKIVDCDKIAHSAIEDSKVKSKLTNAFGSDIINPDGKIDRKLLASRAFITNSETEKLNFITHTFILKETLAQTAEAKKHTTVVIDAPLLFYCGLDAYCDATVAVTADIDTLSRRIALRDKIEYIEVKKRLERQNNMPEMLKKADFLIENGEEVGIEALKEKAVNIYTFIINNDTERKM